ncbi:hypothetical protein SAMN06297251_10436 [Fulvimarina manganoxydans]|uniref:Uncharacterized protein n=1 Tax=Fulvimarina manganoxydans TaxID=937218 RepID=A0A1W2A8R2_9HYPH|nr:hypothetical protein [Fulvimarina manganoxydans]SMC57030.1 hypothetical protein SAMN06297251_10436 [Fulvimarina manganoxydans]
MKLALDPNWKSIAKRAWSIRLMLLAGVLSGAEVALPLLDGLLTIHPGLFAAASGLVTAAAFVARLIAQRDLDE